MKSSSDEKEKERRDAKCTGIPFNDNAQINLRYKVLGIYLR